MECVLKDQEALVGLPDLVLSIGNRKFKIEATDLLEVCMLSKSETNKQPGSLTCKLKIVVDDKAAILGAPFFYSNLVVFDKEKRRIGKPD